MTDDRQERIRQRAYLIWEKAGRPDNQHDEHWRQATSEIDSEDKTVGGPERLSEATVAADVSVPGKRVVRKRRTDESDDTSSGKALTDEGKLSRVAKGEQLEVQHLAETTDLSPNQAKTLLRKHGNDWAKIKDEAENFKAEG